MTQYEKEQLLKKLYEGFCTEQELRLLFNEISAESGDQNEEVLREIWDNLQVYPEMDAPTSEKIFNKIDSNIENEKIEAPAAKIIPMEKAGANKVQRLFLIKIASAAAVIICLFGALLWMGNNKFGYTEISSTYGEQIAINLPRRFDC